MRSLFRRLQPYALVERRDASDFSSWIGLIFTLETTIIDEGWRKFVSTPCQPAYVISARSALGKAG